ncbi:hypothetical protein GCM10023328_19850 [Modestobacter marinus]|uniref:Uncharacterized protein n=1 Tax=Modestobacter marinus TaxID=477641 RepID=A0ABQ2FY99_9ACTN|nr:hypothetical protein GCM10011589_22060 [Modestobacter marinus]
MSLTDLLRSLDDDAAAELERAHQAAADEADRLTREAAAEADRVRSAALAAAEQTGRREAARIVAAARTEAAAEVRAARAEALRAVRERGEQRLADLRAHPGYDEVLAGCLAEALAVLPEPVGVRVDRRDADRVRRLLPGTQPADLTITADLTAWGGCLVADDRGRYVDDTLETRLATAWPAQRAATATRWARAAAGAPEDRP